MLSIKKNIEKFILKQIFIIHLISINAKALSLVIIVKHKTLIIKVFWILKIDNETFDRKTLKFKKAMMDSHYFIGKISQWWIEIAENYLGSRFMF